MCLWSIEVACSEGIWKLTLWSSLEWPGYGCCAGESRWAFDIRQCRWTLGRLRRKGNTIPRDFRWIQENTAGVSLLPWLASSGSGYTETLAWEAILIIVLVATVDTSSCVHLCIKRYGVNEGSQIGFAMKWNWFRVWEVKSMSGWFETG